MPTANYSLSVTGGGISITQSMPRIADGGDAREVVLPVGTAGTVTTRTDNDTGVITVASHAITTSDKVNVFWAGGMRYGMSVTATSGTTITIDVGAGDNLPSTTTPVVITKQVTINCMIDGDLSLLVAIKANMPAAPASVEPSHSHFIDGSAGSVAVIPLVANVPKVYDIAGGSSNPFTGNVITQVKAANGSSVNPLTLQIIVSQDSTP